MQYCLKRTHRVAACDSLPAGCAIRDNLQTINGPLVRFVVPLFGLLFRFRFIPERCVNNSPFLIDDLEIFAESGNNKEGVKDNLMRGRIPRARWCVCAL